MISRGKTEEYCVPLTIEQDGSEFHAYCPDIKGLHVFGKTIEETIENGKQAILAYLVSLMKHGDRIPAKLHAESHENVVYQFCFEQKELTGAA